MKIGAVWDAKVTHLNYVLRGKVVVVDDSMLNQEANETTLSFAINDAALTLGLSFTINDVVLTLGDDDYMPKVGDVITVELTTKVIMGGVFEVGSIHLRLENAVITNIDKCNNLCVIANLSADHLTDRMFERLGIKKHES